MRLPRQLTDRVSDVCRALGIPRNVFYTLAAGKFLIELAPILPGSRRDILLASIDQLIQKTILSVRENQ